MVAEIARAVMPPEEQLQWFASVGRGVDPDWKSTTGDPMEKQPPIPLEQRFAARKLLAAYAMGMPVATVHVEASLKALVATTEVGSGPRTFEAILPGAELDVARENARREVEAMRRRVAQLSAPPDEDGIEDAEVVEP